MAIFEEEGERENKIWGVMQKKLGGGGLRTERTVLEELERRKKKEMTKELPVNGHFVKKRCLFPPSQCWLLAQNFVATLDRI